MLIILKSTHECNLRCAYCYERSGGYCKVDDGIVKTFDEIVRKIEDRNGPRGKANARIIVHGGEPLLLSNEALDHILSHPFVSSIQTNLTLLTDSHIEMFKEYNICVGTSYDGIFKDEESPHRPKQELVAENLHRLRAAGVKTSAIAVLTKQNATQNRLDLLFKQLVHLTDRVQFSLSCGFDQLDKDYAVDAMMYLFKKSVPLIVMDTHQVQPFNHYMEAACGAAERPSVCSLGGCMGSPILGVMPDGTVKSCVRNEQGNTLGNIFKDTINDILGTTKHAYGDDLNTNIPEECKTCDYWSLCHGGCPAERGEDLTPLMCDVTKACYGYLMSAEVGTDFPIYNFNAVAHQLSNNFKNKGKQHG